MKFFPEYDLYICGEDRFRYAKEIKALIKERKAINVYLTGKIEQTEKIWLYRNCESFLFPSKGEGFDYQLLKPCNSGKQYLYQITLVSLKSVMVSLIFGTN